MREGRYRLVSYIRTSTNGGANGDSPAAQEDACRAWATANGHEVVAVLADRGVSGKLPPEERDGLLAALVAVEAGEADGLVVHRLDRFARELHVQEAALARVWSAGGHVFEAVEGEVRRDDPDDPYRRFVRQVMGAAAELERGLIAARLRQGRRRKSERGGYIGGWVPMGWRVAGQGAEAVLVEEPTEQELRRRLRDLRDAGRSYRRVADRLNDDGIPTAGGGRWYAMSVKRALDR